MQIGLIVLHQENSAANKKLPASQQKDRLFLGVCEQPFLQTSQNHPDDWVLFWTKCYVFFEKCIANGAKRIAPRLGVLGFTLSASHHALCDQIDFMSNNCVKPRW